MIIVTNELFFIFKYIPWVFRKLRVKCSMDGDDSGTCAGVKEIKTRT